MNIWVLDLSRLSLSDAVQNTVVSRKARKERKGDWFSNSGGPVTERGATDPEPKS